MKKIGSGKVREIYEVSDKELVIYTTDRVSAFDVILPTPVPEKGRVLNQLSLFWFDLTKDIVKNHLVSADPKDMPEEFSKEEYKDRVMLVKKLKMLPYEFIIRGYMFGSMWKAYQAGEPFCGQVITGDYQLAQKLEKPILTPSTKATEGHDEYSVTHEGLVKDLGEELAQKLEDTCLRLFEKCYDYAYERGIIIADTKLEFGLDENGELVLADEVFTPDSSRFWNRDEYQVGTSPLSYDKQYLRDWLIENKLDGVTPAPQLPADVVAKTQEKYLECLERWCPRSKKESQGKDFAVHPCVLSKSLRDMGQRPTAFKCRAAAEKTCG
mgnify:CR=1 FL=1